MSRYSLPNFTILRNPIPYSLWQFSRTTDVISIFSISDLLVFGYVRHGEKYDNQAQI
ncbi:MAG: hypothetical protein HN601_01940 [Candidatus Marinimicrobia bacterium]|nr:hypothetical protein [Candidatus Neomarinimicrobiota bacterium]